jgi:outer membrane protein assembly factor BamB
MSRASLPVLAAFLLVPWGVAVGAGEQPPSASPLGAAGFRATVEHPFGWRGDGSGRFPGAMPVTDWSTTKNVRWSTDVGSSYSSPIVTDGSVFVTSEPNLLVCLDRADGKVRWKLALTPADLTDPKSRKIAENYKAPKDGSGLAPATPVTHGRSVYAQFANGLLCAVDLEGHRQWSACIEATPNTGYGRSASPIMVAGKLIVHMTNLYAFDLATGRPLWVNAEAQSSYGTPTACRVGDTDCILTPLGDLVRAADGKSLNRGLGRTTHSSPIAGDGLVFFGDSAVRALRFDAAFKATEAWSGMVTGDVFGSPLLHDGTLFLVTGDGGLFAFDAWGKGSLDPLGDPRMLLEEAGGASPAAYASLTLAGHYLFLNSNSGEIVVLEATREARLVSRNQLPEGTGSSPVFSGRDMFLRDGEKLWCIGE